MLKLADFRTKAKGLPDLLPYAALIAPGVILNKNGSLLAAWEVRGQDTASSTPDELAYISAQVNQAVKLLGTGWALHMDAVRSSHRAYPAPEKSSFPDRVTQLIEDERRRYFSRDECYSTNTILTVTYKADFNEQRLSAGVHTAKGLDKALQRFVLTLAELEDALASVLHLQRLEEYDAFYDDGAPYTQSDLLSHIQHCVSGILQPVRVPDTPMYLDALLGSEDLTGGIVPRVGDQHIVTLAIDGLPQESWPAMLADLDALPIQYRFPPAFCVWISTTRPRKLTATARAGGNRSTVFWISSSTILRPAPIGTPCSCRKTPNRP